MIKRIVIAGYRDYTDYTEAKVFLDDCMAKIRKGNKIVILSGGACGADALGERYAKENGFAIEKYLAHWQTYGRAAGPKRNEQMAKTADHIICFWDEKSKGTKSMIDFAQKYNKPVTIKKI